MPASYHLMIWLPKVAWFLFVVAFGACCGSLINVIAYRMPQGLSIVTPPSRCPSCGTRLGWRDNIPVLGWIFLRGRCRYCGTRISPEYPIVEASMAALFGLFFVLYFMVPDGAAWLGVEWGAIKPEWARNPAEWIWPTFAILLILLASLAAMTLVDAKTYMIPLSLTWTPALVAVVAHPLHAAWIQGRVGGGLPEAARGWTWSIPTHGSWHVVLAAIGGVAGLGIANLLLSRGLIRRSFADYAEWERSVLAAEAGPEPCEPMEVVEEGGSLGPVAPDVLIGAGEPEGVERRGAGSGLGGASLTPSPSSQSRGEGDETPLTPALSPQSGGDRGEADRPGPEDGEPSPLPPASGGGSEGPAEMWTRYPHARREMMKEVLFLTPCLLLAMAGWYAGKGVLPWSAAAAPMWAIPGSPPLWLEVLGGVLLGYLVGGGVVWGVRILGSLGFGKEAMGLGDVHVMAAVGACLGWIDATLAFFLAALVGVAWAGAATVFSGSLRRSMPYGPYLAVATVLVLLLKPWIEAAINALLRTGMVVDLP